MTLQPQLVEPVVVQGAEPSRQTPEVPDEGGLRVGGIYEVAECRAPAERQTGFRFRLHLGQRLTRHQQVRDEDAAAGYGRDAIARPDGEIEGAADQVAAASDVLRPGHEAIRQRQADEGLESAQAFALDEVVTQLAEAEPCFEVAEPPGGDDSEVFVGVARAVGVAALQDVVGALAPGGGGPRTEGELDAVPAQDLAERLAQRRRLAREQVLPALHDRHLPAEAADGLRHLHPHRPAAQDQQPPRDRLHPGGLAVGPDPVQLAEAGDGGNDRLGPGREDDVLRGVAGAVHLHHARSGEPSMAPQQVDAVLREPALLPGVGVAGDHEVAPGERGLHVHPCGRGGGVGGVRRLARAQQRLGRDARPVRALAAHELALHQRDAKAAFGQRGGAVLPGRAAADDDHVVAAHDGSSAPDCSATMYAA
jgi:hypothetical protein